MADNSVFPNPCCGRLVFTQPPGSYDICPVCFWEDDLLQLRFPSMAGAANDVSLIKGQKNYMEFGACKLRLKPHVRPLSENEPVENGWRPIDLERDAIENLVLGKEYDKTYPTDPTVLYYWRPTFWRRNAS